MFMDKPTKDDYKRVGMESLFPLKAGCFLPLSCQEVLEKFLRDKNNRKFLAKIISFATNFEYNLLYNKIREYDYTNNISVFDDFELTIEGCVIDFIVFLEGEYKFYQIIIDYNSLFDTDLLITEARLVNTSNNEITDDKFVRYHIHLKNVANTNYSELSEIDKYFKFFTINEKDDLEELCKNDEILMNSFRILQSLSYNSDFIDYLEKLQIKEYSRRVFVEKQKRKLRNDIAKNLLNEGIDINIISKSTGLSIEEIEKL